MNRVIVERERKSDFVAHHNPVLARTLQNRGVSDASELNYSLKDLIHFKYMKGTSEGAKLIFEAIKNDHRIMILGDFDCDGATSTAIMVEGLRLLGAKKVDFMVPSRTKHGYGLSPKVAQEFVSYDPQLLITVDNGISAFEGVDAVRSLFPECKILITDHHLPSDKGNPNADAIINPSQKGCPFPSKSIAGCGVAFYTMLAARSEMHTAGYFTSMGMDYPDLKSLLDILALGTVADVVPLDKNNRLLVAVGLRRINAGQVRPGMRSILEQKKKVIGKIVSQDFGFAAGPCINAAGRLEDMSIGIRCLLSEGDELPIRYAEELVSLNEKRKSIENDMKDEAVKALEGSNFKSANVVFNPSWHEGVVGIVASRIKEMTNRPAICMTNTEERSEYQSLLDEAIARGESEDVIIAMRAHLAELPIKGSVRSVEGVHIKHLIDSIHKEHDYILLGYGGHAMAAGLNIKARYLEEFRFLFDSYVAEHLPKEVLDGHVYVDIKNVDSRELTLELAEQISSLTPWGQHFEEPVFSGVFEVTNHRILQNKHLKLDLRSQGRNFEAIAFNVYSGKEEDAVYSFGDSVEIVFKVSVNEFRGNRKLNLMISQIITQ